MTCKFSKSLFIFRRDLRICDNLGLLSAVRLSAEVSLAFIFDPRQVKRHPYHSNLGFSFLLESLKELAEIIKSKGGKLNFYYGTPEKVVESICKKITFDAVFLNSDYTPFSIQRDKKIDASCRKMGVAFKTYHDALLNDPAAVLKSDRTPYRIYTPYMKAAKKVPVLKPNKSEINNISDRTIQTCYSFDLIKFKGSDKDTGGGRIQGLALLRKIDRFNNYDQDRNIPALDLTTHLSAHHKFGTLSVRETYYAIAKTFSESHTLINQLYWRDFFTQIAFHFPHVFKGAFNKKYDDIRWNNNKRQFRNWCEGRTGFPIVDAGMRELNNTGFMHNRVRMIVASFLIKDLLIDWHWGERYFAQKLVDYDPAVNNGNWQWVASSGCDAQPYFRIFNPWLQQKKFDSECKYIKKWIPELNEIDTKSIHSLYKIDKSIKDYPRPIINHQESIIDTEEIYQTALK